MTTDKQTVVIVIVVFSFRCLSVDVGYVWILYSVPSSNFMLEVCASYIFHSSSYHYYQLESGLSATVQATITSLLWSPLPLLPTFFNGFVLISFVFLSLVLSNETEDGN